MLCVCAFVATYSAEDARTEEFSRDVVVHTKQATAQLIVDGNVVLGTAVCIDPSGLFLTTWDSLQQQGDRPLQLCPYVRLGEAPRFDASVVHSDSQRNLILLQAQSAARFVHLEIETRPSIDPANELLASFSFPIQQASPIEASVATMTLDQSEQATKERIRIKEVLFPKGAPIINRQGKLVGIGLGVRPKRSRDSYGISSNTILEFVQK
ncbi:MAG: trypsin-like peptidase domain-containing protein [Planctomycetales bacterium]|nr:trypsin-like peptidase domain-containing protein [Planctomycetales bacterium]